MISHEDTYVEYCDSNHPPEECSWLLLEESHTVSLYEPCSSQYFAKIAIPSLLVLVESKRKTIIHLLKQHCIKNHSALNVRKRSLSICYGISSMLQHVCRD